MMYTKMLEAIQANGKYEELDNHVFRSDKYLMQMIFAGAHCKEVKIRSVKNHQKVIMKITDLTVFRHCMYKDEFDKSFNDLALKKKVIKK